MGIDGDGVAESKYVLHDIQRQDKFVDPLTAYYCSQIDSYLGLDCKKEHP